MNRLSGRDALLEENPQVKPAPARLLQHQRPVPDNSNGNAVKFGEEPQRVLAPRRADLSHDVDVERPPKCGVHRQKWRTPRGGKRVGVKRHLACKVPRDGALVDKSAPGNEASVRPLLDPSVSSGQEASGEWRGKFH